MPAETLLSAARRAVRFFLIDMARGGLITPETEWAMQILDRQVKAEAGAQSSEELEKGEAK